MSTDALRSRIRQSMLKRRKRFRDAIKRRQQVATNDLRAMLLSAKRRKDAIKVWEQDEEMFERKRKERERSVYISTDSKVLRLRACLSVK